MHSAVHVGRCLNVDKRDAVVNVRTLVTLEQVFPPSCKEHEPNGCTLASPQANHPKVGFWLLVNKMVIYIKKNKNPNKTNLRENLFVMLVRLDKEKDNQGQFVSLRTFFP